MIYTIFIIFRGKNELKCGRVCHWLVVDLHHILFSLPMNCNDILGIYRYSLLRDVTIMTQTLVCVCVVNTNNVHFSECYKKNKAWHAHFRFVNVFSSEENGILFLNILRMRLYKCNQLVLIMNINTDIQRWMCSFLFFLFYLCCF